MVSSTRGGGRPLRSDERRWIKLLSTLNEAQARWFVADKALDLGRGGISRLSSITGMSRMTITKAIGELRGRGALIMTATGRLRRGGGGRKRVEDTDPEIKKLIADIVEETTAGDPMSLLRWTSKSTRTISEELARRGHPTAAMTVARCLADLGYSLQANVKTKEGPQHAERDAQFRYLNRLVKGYVKAGDPVVSVDAKKKELVGTFRNAGRTWRPRGDPVKVNVHDFPHLGRGKGVPYGAYDIARNRAVVNVGVSHDTAEFASRASVVGGASTAADSTEDREGSSSARIVGGATATGSEHGNSVCRTWPTRSPCRSRCATTHPERVSGTRSNTVSSPSSASTGEADLW
jgi:hypothetical protein